MCFEDVVRACLGEDEETQRRCISALSQITDTVTKKKIFAYQLRLIVQNESETFFFFFKGLEDDDVRVFFSF